MSPTPRRLPVGLGRPLALLAMALGLSLLSCGREITGPGNGVRRIAHGLAFIAEFPGTFASVEQGAGSVVAFDKVRVLFRRLDGSTALDSVVPFDAQAQELSLSFSIVLASDAPSTGEELDLYLRYINAAGDTVFAGGPVSVLARPGGAAGTAPVPATVPLVYTGAGAEATGVVASPDTLWLTSGDAFGFTATAHDAAQGPVAAAPLVWSSLDPSRASLSAMNAGAGVTLPSRGTARIRVALAAGALTAGSADTVTLMIAPKVGALELLGGGGQTGGLNATLADSIKLRVNGTDGLPIPGVTVVFTRTTGAVFPDSTVTDSLGIATAVWTLGEIPGTQTLTASAAGADPLAITATAQESGPSQLAITQQPSGATVAGEGLGSVIVEVRNPSGELVDSFADTVSIDIATGPAGAVLFGNTRVAAVAGVATFSDLVLTRRGAFTLAALAPGLSSATSTSIAVASAEPDSLVVDAGEGQTATPGTALAEPIVVRVADAYGNPVQGVNITFAVDVEAGGSFAPPTAATDTAGRASSIWTLGEVPGVQTATISSDVPALPTLEVVANLTTGPIVTTTVSPQRDTLTSIGEALQLAVESRDASLNLVAGSYAWTSRTPVVATVDTLGLVTAVAPGSAWIDVIESGGTRDSAQIVVDQQLSSVDVTPGDRDIYLGAGFDFTAQAVDGNGVPLLTQPVFTWTVLSSAIASVDTAGYVIGVGLGATQVRATAGGITGVANVTIRTPITRIAVVRDSIGFVATDTFTIVALQRTRSYRAVAYDTLDVAMTGIAFTWASANPSVASLDSTGSATARARAQANGITAIRAVAQGVAGEASLRVQQALASIELTPGTASVAPTGVVQLTPRGLDADGFYLSGISGVTFTSTVPSVATVNATTGLVTGVALGTTIIRGTRDALTSNDVVITVSADVPPLISFGRDTLSIGRGASLSIPVYLSRPHTGPVTVNLAAEDTVAYFSQASIIIAAGATTGNATLNGRNAGTTRLFATDGSATGYAGDTASVTVQANVRFSTTSYSMVATNSVSTQILLSDPAPAGGTYVSYAFGTPGVAEISPDPAFIPAGQLSVNVVITGLAGGTTTVTPAATGVNGQVANITVSAPVLNIAQTSAQLGLGQYRTDTYVTVPNYLNQPLTVTVDVDDSTVVNAPETVTIPTSNYYQYIGLNALSLGETFVRTRATGFSSDSMLVRVTTPRLDLCCNSTRTTTSAAANLTVYTTDSTLAANYRINPLVVSLVSRDTSIVRLLSSTMTVQAGAYYASDAQFVPGGEIGSTYVVATASGHGADSVLITVNGPKLSFSFASDVVGLGQELQNHYVSIPDYTASPRTIFLSSSDSAIAAVPDSVIIPAGSYYANVDVESRGLGSVQLFAGTAGHEPDTATVHVSSPRITTSGGGTFNAFAAPSAITVYAADSLNNARYRLTPLVISYVSSDTTVVRVTGADTILAGAYYSNHATVSFVGIGSATVTATADGHQGASLNYTVQMPRLNFSFTTYRLGARQYRQPNEFYVSTPNARADSVHVTITQSNAAIDSLTTTAPVIPPNLNYAYFSFAGFAPGADTLIATAPGYLPDTAVLTITTPRLYVPGIASTATTTSAPGNLTVYAADSTNGAHYSLDTVVVSVGSTDSAVVVPTAPSARILPGQYYVNPTYAYVGPGTARLFVSDSLGSGYLPDTSDNAVTVTGPSLSLYNGRPRLGMRQNGAGTSAYVAVPNAVAGSPLVVYLVSTDPLVASVPDSVVIPVGQTYAYFSIVAHDVVGTVQIQATALGYSPATVNQEVTAAHFYMSTSTSLNTTSPAQTVYVAAADASGTQHYVNEDVVVTLASSSTAVGTIDSATVTIPAGGYYSNTARFLPDSAGSTQLSATDGRTELYRYNTATAVVSVNTPDLSLSWSAPLTVGVGQWVEPYVSVPDTRVSPLTVSFAHSGSASATAASTDIPAGLTYTYFRVNGVSVGADTLLATAAGHDPISRPIAVGLGRIDGIGAWPTSLATDSVLVTLYPRDQAGNTRAVVSATTFNLSADANVEFVSGGVAGVSVPITSVVVPADGTSVNFYVKRIGTGTANVTISATNYQTYNSSITVNAP